MGLGEVEAQEQHEEEDKQVMKKKAFIAIVLLSLLMQGRAQLTFSPADGKDVSAATCWRIRLQNLTGARQLIILSGKIYGSNDSLLFECESEKLMLNTGTQLLSEAQVNTKTIRFYNDEIKQQLALKAVLPPGRYKFCTTAKAHNSEELLGEDCLIITAIAAKDSVNLKSVLGKLKEKGIEFYGNAGVEHIYSNRQGTDQVMPPHLVRVWAQPSVMIYNVPLTLNMFYTTERNGNYPNPFAISLSFDADKFKETLRQKVEEKILETTKLDVRNLQKSAEQLKELDGIDNKLKDAASNKVELQNLQKQISSADFAGLEEQFEQLKEQGENALAALNYKEKKEQLESLLAVSMNESPEDSASDANRTKKIDSLNLRLLQLEAKKDSVLQKSGGLGEKLKALEAKKQKLNELMTRLNQVKTLAAQFQKLGERKAELEQLQQKLSNLKSINTEDISRLGDPNALRQALIDRGLFTGVNRLFFGVKQLSIGTSYPVFSPLTLNGIQVHGASVAINPGLFYLHAVGGNTHLGATNFQNIFKSAYQRWMAGGKIGVGKTEQSHFYLSYIHSFDRKNTLPVSMEQTVRPLQNDVLAAELQLTFWKKRIRLFAEAAGTGFNRNINDSLLRIENVYYKKIPAFLKPNLSTSYDYAYSASAYFNFFKGNNITLFTDYVGPGFTSFGVPFLRNDVLRYGGKVEQSVWKNRIRIRGNYKYEIDNLIESKRAATVLHFFGGGISFNQRKWPSLKADYSGTMRRSVFGNMLVHALAASASHTYRIAKVNLRTALNYQYLNSSADSINVSEYTLHNVMLTQGLSFRYPYTVFATVGYNQLQNFAGINRQVQFGAGLTGQPVKNLGMAATVDFTKNLNSDYRLGTQFDISYLLLNHITFGINLRYNKYQSAPLGLGAYNEIVLTSRLLFVW